MGPISILIKLHLILIFLIILDILMYRFGSKASENRNHQQTVGNYTNGYGDDNYQNNVFQPDYTEY